MFWLFNGTPPPGITAFLYDPLTGILTLTGTASLAAYQTALQQITFDNTGTTPSTETRIIDVVVNDGTAASNLAHAIIDVTQVDNIAPVVNLDADDSTVVGTSFRATFTEGGAPIPIADIDTLITDTDSTTLASATITLTDPQAGDLLAATRRAAGRHHGFQLRPGHRNPDALRGRLARRLRDGPGSDPLQRSRRESGRRQPHRRSRGQRRSKQQPGRDRASDRRGRQ